MFNINKDEDFGQTVWGKVLLEEINEELIDSILALEETEKKLSFNPDLDKFWLTIRHDIEMLENFKNNLNSWDSALEAWKNTNFVTWPRTKIDSELKEEAKSIRDDVKKKINDKISKILTGNAKQINEDILEMYQILLKLKNIILEFDEIFSKKKRDKNIVDFSDIEHFALNILLKLDENGKVQKSEVAKKYQDKFEEIAIDEYQDSNLVQEYILTSIARENNLFMVGDVKQSIYKFRQAMPELFLSKYNSYKKVEDFNNNEKNIKIQLFKNFRSRKNILDFTNLIFENIMSNLLGDVEYNQEEFLNLGATDYKESTQELQTQIDIINLKQENTEENEETTEDNNEEQEERLEDIELEAKYVANQIKKLVDDKFQIYDRKKEEFRNIKYKDIVILLRSTKNKANIFEQEILNLNMPVFSDTSQEYLDSVEIQTIMALLKIIDNPIQDIPLVTVLRSSIGEFTDNDLVKIRLSDKYDNFYNCMLKAKVDVDKKLKQKIEKFLNNLETWRKEQEYLALDELIWKIYEDTGYYHYVGLMPNGLLRQANLRMLFERAKQYEKTNFKGLFNFIHFIEKLKLSSGDLGSAKLIGENDDVIRIMSIHKSKGLEFPVVFLANTGKQFNMQDIKLDPILLHQDMGIGVKYIDYDKQVEYDTPPRAAIKSKILKENISEEMRILYVALTRAKEKLIITGISKDYDKDIQNMEKQVSRYPRNNRKINPILLQKQKRYLDWIILVYLYEKQNDALKLNVINKKDAIKSFKKIEKEEKNAVNILEQKNIKKEEVKKVKEKIEKNYQNELSTKIQSKTTVTKIKQINSLSEIPENMDIIEYLNMEKNEQLIKNDEINLEKPKFLKQYDEEKITGAKKGTLMHLCMQKLDEKKDYTLETIKEFINNLKEKGIITKNEANNINPYKILEYTKSKIWKELKDAKEIQKEKPFHMKLTAKEIYGEDIEEDILVQGIIDLYYITKNDKLVLLDYKTDFVENGKENTLVEKYKMQLDLYKKALESGLGKKVDEVYIYSIFLGKEIKL